MRLRQLARKLGVQPDKILAALAEHGHTLENEANSKLSDEQVTIIESEFDMPTPAEEEATPIEEEKTAPQITPVAEVIAEPEIATPELVPAVEEVNEVTEEPVAEQADEDAAPEAKEENSAFEVPFGPPAHATSQVSEIELETETLAPITEATTLPTKIQLEPEKKIYKAYEEDDSYAEAELIKTETPQLEGLKVVGKIELPEPKKPEDKEETEGNDTEAREEKDQGRQRNQRGRKGRQPRERMNSVEYERKKAERLAKRKKADAEKKLKEKKKEHYLTHVKPKKAAAATKTNKGVKPKREEEEMTPLPIIGQSRPKVKKQVEKKPKSKKGLKHLWAWLNGEYDKF